MPRFASQIDALGIPFKGFTLEPVTAFPTGVSNGYMVHRTDLNQGYILINGTWKPISFDFATTAEAQAGTDTTKAVNAAGVKAAINTLIAGAPGALDTLDELAAALGDDPNFRTTLLNLIGTKIDLAGDGLLKQGTSLSVLVDGTNLVINGNGAIGLSSNVVNQMNNQVGQRIVVLPALTKNIWNSVSGTGFTFPRRGLPAFSDTPDVNGQIYVDYRWAGNGTSGYYLEIRPHIDVAANAWAVTMIS